MSGMRYLASLLIRHARQMLPDSRSAWADAMEIETRHIRDDREALSWAVGCVFAAYADRLRMEQFLLPLTARLLLAAWCLQFPAFHVWQFTGGAAAAPASLEGYEPLALQVLSSIVACLYLIAGLRLAFTTRPALLPYSAACLISFTAFGYMGLFLEQAGGVLVLNLMSGAQFSLGPMALMLDALEARFFFGVALPILLGVAISVVDRYDSEIPTARRLV